MEYQRASAATAFSKKLSHGHSFNGKNMYDGVFSGQSKVGSSVEDYAEIFGGGSGSSIPVLDVPELNERKFSVDVSSSKLEYSNIFGGFGDFEYAVSHEEFIAKPPRAKQTPAKTRSYSEGSFSYPLNIPVGSNDQTSHESGNGVKQFKMSYNKISPGSKNGANGTTHVAQLHAVPGYTRLVDGKITSSRDKPDSSVVNETYKSSNSSEGTVEGMHKKPVSSSKQTSTVVEELRSKSGSNGSDFNDVLFGSYDVGRRTPPKVPRASSMLNNMGGNKRGSMKLGVFRSYSLDGDVGVSSPPYLDDEVDANSVAATSAAAVKKAIEEAQARLKIAKELMERRKGGHVNRTKPSFNGVLKAEERKKSKDTVKQNDIMPDMAQETCEKIDASVQTPAEVRKQNVIKVDQVAAESDDSEKIFTAREAAGGTCAKNFTSPQANCRHEEAEKREAAKQGEREKEVMQALNEYEGEEKKIIENLEKYGEKSEAVEEVPKQEVERKLDASKELCDKDECLNKKKLDVEFHDRKEDETKLGFSEPWEETENKMSSELEACESNLKEPEKPTEDERKVEMQELKVIDNMETLEIAQDIDHVEKRNHVLKQEENGCGLEDVFEKEENEMLLPYVSMQKELGKRSEEAFEISELKAECKEACGAEENKEEEEDDCSIEDNEQMSDEMEEQEIIDLRHNNFDDEEEREGSLEEDDDLLEDEEFMEAEENSDMFEDAYQMEAVEEGQKEAPDSVGTEEMQKLTDQKADEMTELTEAALECCEEDLEAANDAYKENEINNLDETLESSINEDSCEMTPDLLVNEENGGIAEGNEDSCEETRIDSEAVEVAGNLEENLAFDNTGLAESNFNLNEIEQQSENKTEAIDFDRNGIDIDTAEISFEQKQYEQHSKESEIICTLEKHVEELACESEEDVRDAEVVLKQEENKNNFEFPDEGRLVDSLLHGKFREKHETTEIAHDVETSQSTENNEENHHETLTKEERETKNNSQEDVELEKEQQRRVDEAKERKREREKERIAVERAIREARERAFAEVRERAAAGRTNVEGRRKVKADAQGESAKPSAEVNDKAFMEAKLKAERAAVERATAEARQRALEKALSEKAAFGARNQAEKFSDAKQSFQSYDSHYKGSCPPATGRYPNSSNQSASNSSEGLDGATGESAQRCKARLERHQRTAERAAKALAEKNKRDLLAQKEQAERNRLAEPLDAEVKRWSSGKQGNLRALLSTLQYILGPDCGWQPIPLTDIIATAAVKKAYRKATLCVHPDKLQQRGASIQQKYTCEKVFDLLKEGWNKFSAEER
ncbi:hypothetical protein QUC31_000220 [Theobroma cacao]